MAIDRKAMKEKLLSRSKLGGKRGRAGSGILKSDLENINFWKCKEGDHIIDIIPYAAGKNDPMTPEGDPTYCVEFYVHRDLGPTEDQRVICLADTYGQACPVCEHRRQLQKEGAEDSVWKGMFAKQRNLYNVICYDTEKEEERGVQVWEVAWFYMEKHLSRLAKGPMQRGGKRGGSIDPNIAFADPDEGRSISFTVETKGREFHEYGAHQFEERDYVIDDETLEEAVCLDELLSVPTYEEVYELYWGEAPEEQEEVQKPKPKRAKKAAAKTKQSKKEEPEDDQGEDQEEPEDPAPKRTPKRKPQEKKETKECPIGAKFGEDVNEYQECDDCNLWEECVEAKGGEVDGGDEAEGEEPVDETPPEPKRTPKRTAPAGKRVRRTRS